MKKDNELFFKRVISEKSIVTDFTSETKILWVLFGGINGGLGVKILEFGKITENFNVNKIFVRDLNQMYFQKGIREDKKVNNIFETIDYLKQLIIRSNASKVAFIGNSAGGYAALLFGKILGVDEIHAFSPQTILDKNITLKNKMHFLYEVIEKINSEIEMNNTFDLSNYFNKDKEDSKSNFCVYYDKNSYEDRIHAENLMFSKEIKFYKFPYGEHNLIKHLKENGILYNILSDCYCRMNVIKKETSEKL